MAMAATSVGASSDADMAAVISAFWDGPFGAVSEDDRPSWLIAEPCNIVMEQIKLQDLIFCTLFVLQEPRA
jgi:hypothetical protein